MKQSEELTNNDTKITFEIISLTILFIKIPHFSRYHIVYHFIVIQKCCFLMLKMLK